LDTTNQFRPPHRTVMCNLLEGDEIVFKTKAGRKKDSNLTRDPRVSLLVYDSSGYKYLRIDGKVRIIPDPQVTQADIHRLARRYQGDADVAERAIARFGTEERISYRLRTDRVYDYR